MKVAFWGLLGAVAEAKRNAYIYVMNGNLGTASAVESYFMELANAGTSHLMSSFLVPGQAGFTNGEADTVAVWSRLSSSDQASIVNKLHSVGSELLLVSAGGHYGTIYLNYEPNNWADIVCGHAKEKHYDGVDMDLENFSGAQAAQFVPWAIAATQRCYNYVSHVTHAPQSPYFHSGWGNAYDKLVDYVDHLLVQFYNQGYTAHTDYQSTFVKDASWPTWQDLANTHPQAKQKFVVGKYVYPGFGGSGMFTPDQFAEAVQRAERELGYNAGIMIWRAPQPGETSLYRQFIDVDLPKMSGRDDPSTGGTGPTSSTTTSSSTTTTTRTTTSTTTRGGIVNPPAPTAAPPVTGDLEVYCSQHVGAPGNPSWDIDCKAMCTHYHAVPAFCGVTEVTADTLIECVLRLHPYCVRL
eukprot:Protomagalhaensia_wolfi_Nauph_80__851@NODE_1492_length_1504_cov_31_524915_g1156_i0_p1_GENE_NODE_1492_length_1504_cov_31_524915_g1156_i0NODE_1492_length_1504_cov_31_524915_g1156_i0_p1_ORF_typecomplete_len439_score77_10Glyco_hydro_18/PF00704_28/3_6e09DUF4849/PF16141_5/0_017T3SS_needle_F/PF09392_10/0_19T3SS_needle_F/PF09392_10/1_8e044_1_CTD/PF05902_13/1_1_NODE_1492_length_1504_cov_31_524915_g1156_i01871416